VACGLCSGAGARELIEQVVDQVVVPQLASEGVTLAS